jgi:hypothetical protein
VRARHRHLLGGALAGVLGGAALVAQSCVLPDFEIAQPVEHDAAPPVEAGPSFPCGKGYPDPPTSGDDSVATDVVLAIRSIDMGEGNPTPPGYDLDHACTCIDGGGGSCVPAVVNGKAVCDGPGGVDNSAATILNLIKLAVGAGNFGSDFYSAQAEQGAWSLLVHVWNYNGQADDPQVDVALLASPGMGFDAAAPKWDGNDVWPISGDSVQNGDYKQPKYRSTGAYVAGGVLVAAIPDALITFSGTNQTITIHVTGGVLTGTLVGAGATWRIADGVLAARWSDHDIFAALSTYRDSNGLPYCAGAPIIWDNAKGLICAALDIQAADQGVKSLPCDALSMGIGFHAESAFIGAAIKPPTPTPGCPPATDPANESCFPKPLDAGADAPHDAALDH